MLIEQRLRQPDCTNEDVLEFLTQRSARVVGHGGMAMPADEFWTDQDLERFRAAEAAWAKDAPPMYALGDLPMLLSGVAGARGQRLLTFLESLTLRWDRYVGWMTSQGRDPANANETVDQRRTRKARESMARTRARRSVDSDPALRGDLLLVQELHEAYLAACRARKSAYAELTADVQRAEAAWRQAREAIRAS